MLILPLHQPLTRANFPIVTALLVLLNCAVFVLLQGRDGAAIAAADAYYHGSGLARIEAPLAQRHYSEYPDPRMQKVLAQVPAELHEQVRAGWQQQDETFRQRLASGELFDDRAAQTQWLPLAAEFEQRRTATVVMRYGLRAARPSFETLLTATFLHGGLDHLFGNMLFLVALGLLVEGALGGLLFAAVYGLGGVAANAAWLAFNNEGLLIGASGAVAALMGAFCVLWGRRRVRFFYWVGVVFDYVRAPALALLPLWLGWELLQWKLSEGDRVAYEAHAGGIVAGALLALLVRRLNWQRDSFFEAPAAAAPAGDDLAAARLLLGRMRLPEAAAALHALEQRQPGRWDVAALRHRCARLAGSAEEADGIAARAIAMPLRKPNELREQWQLLQEVQRVGGTLSTALRLDLLQRLLAQEQHDSARELAVQIELDDVSREKLPQLLLALALRLQERGSGDSARGLLERVLQHFPGSVEAGKAAFLLDESGPGPASGPR